MLSLFLKENSLIRTILRLTGKEGQSVYICVNWYKSGQFHQPNSTQDNPVSSAFALQFH